jgi:hypothetical protein
VILQDFEKLIEEKKLFGAARDPAIIDGAELDPALVKKRGKGSRFIIRKVPSKARLLRLWALLFGTSISPCALFEALSARTHEFEQRENRLLFSQDRIIYDTQIHRGEESVGELTLSFGFLKRARLKVVYIEHFRLTAQRAGYASTLFRYYERLFYDLGFNQFQLHASLSVGKYYWALEGFDFSDKSEIEKRKGELRALIKERGLPVGEDEIESVKHAFDFARFKKEVRIPVYRDAEGFYSLRRDDRFGEEVSLPLGKAFLLSAAPWEGWKSI